MYSNIILFTFLPEGKHEEKVEYVICYNLIILNAFNKSNLIFLLRKPTFSALLWYLYSTRKEHLLILGIRK